MVTEICGVSREDILNDLPVNIGQSIISPLKTIGELLVVNAKAMEQRCMKIMNVDWILNNVVAEVVGLAMRIPTFDSAACHPNRKTSGVMVSTKSIGIAL